LTFIGPLAGIASGLTIPIMFVSQGFIHPLVSSTVLWGIVGAIGGLCGYASREPKARSTRVSRSRFEDALVRACAGALCAGGVWAAVVFNTTFLPDDLSKAAVEYMIFYGVFGTGYGLLVGLVTGLLRRRGQPVTTALALGFGGAVFGALGGSLS